MQAGGERLPPGPEGPALTTGAAFMRHPLGMLRGWRHAYGDVFTLRLPLVGSVVVVADPAVVGELMESDPGRARAGEARRAVLPMASAHSTLGGDDAVHSRQRGRLAAEFSAAAMAPRREAIAALAERHAREWPRGRPFQLLSRLRALVDEVFVRVMLGVGDERRASRLVGAVGAMLRIPGNPPLAPPGEGDGRLGAALGEAVFAQRREPVARLLGEEGEARSGRGGEGDLIAALLAADPPSSKAEIVDELITMLMAAQEPPSIALAWMLDRLARHPRLAADYLAAGEGSPLRAAVLSESLRLRPSGLAALRHLTEPLRAGGQLLPAGTETMVPIPLLQRDRRFFDDPDVFRPARWRGVAEPPPVYRPFGGGARGCLGEPLARAEVAAAVPAILGAVRLRPLWPRTERMVARATTLVPHRSVPVLAA